MANVTTLVAELLTYAHAANDSTVMKRCLEQALREMRNRRVEWGEGTMTFVTEPGVPVYPFGTYPRIPGGIMSLTSKPLVGISALQGSVLEPDTLVSSSNLELDGGGAATIAPLQDSAEKPDDNDLKPTAAATSSFEVRWDVALTRPLIPGLREGAGRQIMRVSMFNKGTDRVVSWQLKEGGSNVAGASGTWTVNSSSRSIYEAKWDATLLSTLNPAANQISLLITDATGNGEVSFSAVQWFTATRDEQLTISSGQYPMEIEHQSWIRELLSGRIEVITGIPDRIAIFDEHFYLYPTPNGAYLVTLDYQKDSTRDETTNAKIDTSSTTETNEWFRDGYLELAALTLEKYQLLRPQNAKAAQMAQVLREQARGAQNSAYEQKVFQQPASGWL